MPQQRPSLETVNLDQILLHQPLLGQKLQHVLALIALQLYHLHDARSSSQELSHMYHNEFEHMTAGA